MLEEDAIEHGEDGLLLGLGEPAEALELALELRGRPPLAGVGAGDAEQDIGRDGEERGELGHERDGEAEPADLVVGEGRRPCALLDAAAAANDLTGKTIRSSPCPIRRRLHSHPRDRS